MGRESKEEIGQATLLETSVLRLHDSLRRKEQDTLRKYGEEAGLGVKEEI